MKVEYHRTLLADRLRNDAFYAALQRAIVPGKSIVADIGCGTGLLGFMAAKLGAKRVFLLEAGDIVSIARKLARENGIRNIEIVPAHSTEVTPPEPVDIVVSETLGNYAYEENIIETLNDARTRYLKPGGVLMPNAVAQYVAPVISPRVQSELSIWDDVGFGLSFEAAKTAGLNNIYVRRFEAHDLLDSGRSAILWDDEPRLGSATKVTRQGKAAWTIPQDTVVHGLALWWSARLDQRISLSTSPLDPSTHWEQLYLPFEKPMAIQARERLTAEIKSKSTMARGTDVTWTVATFDRNNKIRASQLMDLRKGFIA